MKKENEPAAGPDKKYAAVCGLYCEACSVFIATREDPARLRNLAARFQLSDEAMKCHGCRSNKRWPYCEKCKMSACAAEKGISFCVECKEYPCEDLKTFQAERPHRIELWEDLKRIKAVGHEQWLREIHGRYACPQCRTINSAYDLKCRKCGEDPGNEYVRRHKKQIEQYLMNR